MLCIFCALLCCSIHTNMAAVVCVLPYAHNSDIVSGYILPVLCWLPPVLYPPWLAMWSNPEALPLISAQVGHSPSSCLTIFVETCWWDPLSPHLHNKQWFLNPKYKLYLFLLCPHLGHSRCKPFWCEHILLWALYLINYALVIQCIG